MSKPLDGLNVLVLEDEFLIAMDVEELCREYGAAEVSIVRTVHELPPPAEMNIQVAVLDVMLSGVPTFGFAQVLEERGVPFVFATGHAADTEMFANFRDVRVVGKPYSGPDLIDALRVAIATSRERASSRV